MNSWFELSTAMGILPTIAATGILVWAVVEDIRTRKFSNRTFFTSLGLAVAIVLVSGGRHAMVPGSLGLAAGFVILLPLVLTGVVGAGDMKLMGAFGFLAGWNAVLWTVVYGIVWAAIFGVIQILVRRQGHQLISNLTTIAVLKTRQGLELHRIPFTVPLLLGWLNHLVLTGGLR